MTILSVFLLSMVAGAGLIIGIGAATVICDILGKMLVEVTGLVLGIPAMIRKRKNRAKSEEVKDE